MIHYSAHPRIFPNLEGKDWPAVAQTGNFNQVLLGYKLTHIKRATEIVGFFDGTLYNRGDYWTTSACAYSLDVARIQVTTPTGSSTNNTFLTDWYGIPSTNPAPGLDPNSPVDMTPFGNGPSTSAADWNADTLGNWGNIRFRHMNNIAANVLMMDGHVQTFYYNKSSRTTDLLRKNINVTK
jgi:prepilin-type processing-associated H-X9-DG protein